jgi:hypothetical protein
MDRRFADDEIVARAMRASARRVFSSETGTKRHLWSAHRCECTGFIGDWM